MKTLGNKQGMAIYLVTPSTNGCVGGTIQVKVLVDPMPQPVLQNGFICINKKTCIVNKAYTRDTKLNRTDYTFDWYYNSIRIEEATTEMYEANREGDYGLIAINKNTGCVSYPIMAHIEATFPGLELDIDQTRAFEGAATLSINVIGGNATNEYQLNNDEFGNLNVIWDVKAGSYIVTVRDTNGCTYLSKNIYILGCPKFFTPNGDGFNDTWNIIGLVDQANAKVYIYDRYGKLLKQIHPGDSGWDGTFNGVSLPASDYWFTLEYTNKGIATTFKSHLTLKR